jgi:hypothetical protein
LNHSFKAPNKATGKVNKELQTLPPKRPEIKTGFLNINQAEPTVNNGGQAINQEEGTVIKGGQAMIKPPGNVNSFCQN